MPASGRAWRMRHRKPRRFSAGVGALKDMIRSPWGSIRPALWRITPPLPDVSMPCSTSRMLRRPPLRPSAYRRSCHSETSGPSAWRAALPSALPPGEPGVERVSYALRSTGPAGTRSSSSSLPVGTVTARGTSIPAGFLPAFVLCFVAIRPSCLIPAARGGARTSTRTRIECPSRDRLRVGTVVACTCQSDQAGQRAQVFLPVAALEHVRREHPVQWYAAGQQRDVPVVHPVCEHHHAERGVLVRQLPYVEDPDRVDPIQQSAVLAGVQLREVPVQIDEVVARRTRPFRDSLLHQRIGPGFGCLRQASVAVVLPVD